MAASSTLTRNLGSPLTSPKGVVDNAAAVVSAQPTLGFDESPHVVAEAGRSALQPSTLAAPPAPPGVYSTWKPVAEEAPKIAVTAVEAADRSRQIARAATVLIGVCVVVILALVILSALRLSSLADLGLSSEQLSDRFRSEALLWVPPVAIFSVCLAGAALVRTKYAN